MSDSLDERIGAERLRQGAAPVHDVLDAFRPELLRVALRICGERDAEDAVQVALLRAGERTGEFRGETDAQLRAWLRTIVRNQCLAQLRAGRRLVERPAASEELELARRLSDSGGTPSQAVRRQEESEQLLRLLSELTQEQFEAISYRYFEAWPIAEIAQQMGRSESAVAGLLARGLSRLRQDTSPSEWSQLLK